MQTAETKNLGPFLKNKFGDRYLYEINRNAFSQVSSETLFDKIFQGEIFSTDKLYILIGTDSGLLVKYFIAKGVPDGSRYIFIEHPSVLQLLIDQEIISSLPDNITVVTVDDLETQAEKFQFNKYVYRKSVRLLDSLSVTHGFFHSYKDVADAARGWVQCRTFDIAASIGVAPFMTKMLENLGENRCPALLLQGFFKGRAAVILAGGPSLDEFLPWVKKHQGKLIVVAVSRIAKRLLAEGLSPHFVISVDPQDFSFDISRDMLELYEQSVFVNASYVAPGLISQWRGESIYLGPLFPWDASLNQENIAVTGPTVTNSALTFVTALGCSQVIFAGVDLCFSKQGYTHAQGSSEAIAPLISTENVMVQTNAGEWAETTAAYRSAIGILDKQAAQSIAQGCHIVNLASGAAKIDHVKYVPVSEIVLPMEDVPSFNDIIKSLSEFGIKDRVTHYNQVIKELQRAEKRLIEVNSLAKEALVCNDGLFGRKGKKRNFKYKHRLDQIENKLNTCLGDFSLCLKKFAVRKFLTITRIGDRHKMTDAEIESSGRVYYQAFRDSAEEMLSLVQRAKKRLEARIEEEKDNPNIEMMVQQWRDDNQPGRLMVWRGRNHALGGNCSDSTTPHTESLLEEFHRLMTNNDISGRLIARRYDLSQVRARALTLFQENNQQGLEYLLGALEVHPDQEAVVPFTALVQGYLYERKGESDTALEKYQQLIGQIFDDLTEDVLRRIASLSMAQKNWEMALLALECLKNAATYYLPQYADLLRILGEHQSAADAYVDYLEKVPEDLTVMLKLGQLYRSMGHEHEAQQVFRLALDQEPQNREAEDLLQSSQHH